METEVERQVRSLHQLSTGRLAERYAELFGETTRTRNRTYLIRKIAWKMQARTEGDLSQRARQRAAELAAGTELRVMAPRTTEAAPPSAPVEAACPPSDARLPMAGTAVVRQYKGRTLEVLVLADGFEFEGERYKSLSAVAKRITGSHVNGFRFFGLEGKR